MPAATVFWFAHSNCGSFSCFSRPCYRQRLRSCQVIEPPSKLYLVDMPIKQLAGSNHYFGRIGWGELPQVCLLRVMKLESRYDLSLVTKCCRQLSCCHGGAEDRGGFCLREKGCIWSWHSPPCLGFFDGRKRMQSLRRSCLSRT